ncbi:uncharacterized protein LOC120002620 [Tripterygium wilfordii]|uniref:uncharacterized protein LOC120002620 n=1 Tax=Tripterygium wilfordii TaxID=458696 RepID=UPI0018F83E80|nr:uncharacterized protein LOC120002620 [Tripterygium wilfordii]
MPQIMNNFAPPTPAPVYPTNPFLNPFNLLPSDFSVSKLISLELNGANYQVWSANFTNALEARNKVGYIDGTLPIPEVEDQNHQLWKQANGKILQSISTWKTTQELWSDLKARFSVSNATRVYEVMKEISNMKQGNQSVSDYHTKMKSLWNELQDYQVIPKCKRPYDIVKPLLLKRENEKVMQSLMGLNDNFSAVSSQILLTF